MNKITKWIVSLPIRIVAIPLFWAAIVLCACFLVMCVAMVPFVCLFGTITYKGKKIL